MSDYWPTPRDYHICSFYNEKKYVNDSDLVFDLMKKNIGKEVMFQIEDGTQFYGKIAGVPNLEHYKVIIERKGFDWEWYVSKEAVHFVINPKDKLSKKLN